MPNIRNPRSGSMQFWPRKRSKRVYARVKSWAKVKDAKLLGFAGYKVGMTHAIIIDNKQKSITKGQEISCPITVIECPPLKSASIRFYKKTIDGLKVVSEIFAENLDKELKRKIIMPKSVKKKIEDIKEYDDITLLVYTQPKLTGIGRKKPEIFEIGLGGNKEDKLKFAQEKLGKEIPITEVFEPGQQMDIHAVTTGKGFQGPVKRFGISLRQKKSEKSVRNPGSLGGWSAQGHVMYRVAHAGKMGYHKRTDYNKILLQINDKPEEVNRKGGFGKYGLVKNTYILVSGSVAGPKKRIIRFNTAIRPNKNMPNEAPTISYLSK
jgi:large subunit ribosomal protein L3